MKTKPIQHVTIGSVEYLLCQAEGNRKAYAIANRLLIGLPDDNGIISAYFSDIKIQDTIRFNGIKYPVTEIAENSFENMPISSVSVPRSVTVIRSRAFYCCKFSMLKGCRGVKTIESEAFFRCHSLSGKLKFPALEHLGAGAFKNTSISSIVLPASLKTMSFDALYHCVSLKNVTMHGSTELVYDPLSQNSRYFLEENARLRLKPPYTSLRRKGKCLVNAQCTKLYHLFCKDGDDLSVPSSISEVDGDPFYSVTFGTIRFPGEKNSSVLSVNLSTIEFKEIVCYRPICVKWLPSAYNSCNIHCHHDTILFHNGDLSNINIIIYKGVNVDIDISDVVAYPNFIYKEGVKCVGSIHPGSTVIGPDVKEIGAIEEQTGFDKDDDIAYKVTMQCSTPPHIGSISRGVLAGLQLTVPKGCLEAYANHKVWKNAAIITDGTTVAVDRISSMRRERKKKRLTEEMSVSVADRFTKMLFGEMAHVERIEDTLILLTVPLNVVTKAVKSVCYRKKIDIAQAGDPNTWDAIEAEFNRIKSFIG